MNALQKLLVNLSTVVVGASGLVYAWMKYVMTTEDPFAVVNHPLQPWVLDAHLLASPVLVFGLGLIVQEHIVAQFQKGPNRSGRGTGLLALACLMPMIATGYLIQVFVDETARRVCVWAHLVTGMIYLGAFVAHLITSRRIAARRRAEAARAAAAGVTLSAWRRREEVVRARSRTERVTP